jgi:hypothetical protein
MNLDAGHLAIIGKSRKTSTQAFEGPNNPKGPDLSKSQQIFLSLVLKTRRKALTPRGAFFGAPLDVAAPKFRFAN